MLQNEVVDRIGENFLVSCEPVCSTVQMFATGSRNVSLSLKFLRADLERTRRAL